MSQCFETPNPNIQAPGKSQCSKLQTQSEPIEYWNLNFPWGLGFGIWGLTFRSAADEFAAPEREAPWIMRRARDPDPFVGNNIRLR
jgi:hypothetical protein